MFIIFFTLKNSEILHDFFLFRQGAKTQEQSNSESAERVSNGVPQNEVSNGEVRVEKENKEVREKRNTIQIHQ